MTTNSAAVRNPSNMVPRRARDPSVCTSYSESVAASDHGPGYCPVLFGLLRNTPDSGKIALTVPSALL